MKNPFERVAQLRKANPQRKPDSLEGRVPPGQYLTTKFPVLTYGPVPSIPLEQWKCEAWGLVEEPKSWSYQEFLALPHVTLTADFHCVTRWSQLDNTWEGISIHEVMKQLRLKPEAGHVMVHSYGGYTTNLPLEDLLQDNVLFAYKRNGENLSPDHGWPMRLIVPHLYAWKSAKWVRGLEFIAQDRPGFWETYGYHMHGDPWTEERFS
ncbi:MAG: sulfite oxidase-like oxidoreductase [Deinococcus sp.]|nr:sulfite oxidase-like oxidoreductase [Deinococcus sp.]